MALGVCYLDEEGRPDYRNGPIYLQQRFYESAHVLVDRGTAGGLLTRILTMGYGGNTLVRTDRLQALQDELEGLATQLGSIRQLDELRNIVRTAQQASNPLVFYGDMYPELDKPLRESIPPPPCPKCGELHKSAFWDICDCGHQRDGADS